MVRILIVEDDVITAMALTEEVSLLGHFPVGPAHDVADALALLATSIIDVAIVDYRLGTSDSRAVADALDARAIPYLWLTGYEAAHIETRGAPVVVKPAASYTILDQVTTIIGSRCAPRPALVESASP